jgi:hypothetical protein
MRLEIEKENRNKSGVYKINNHVNENFYIGSANIFTRRFSVHLSVLRKGCHHNQHLQNAYKKYGGDNFSFTILEITKDRLEREQCYLDLFFDYGLKCYNMSSVVELNGQNLKYKKDYQLISPDNELIVFKDCFIADISHKIEVGVAGLYALFAKKCISHFGWRLPENKDYNYENWRDYNRFKKRSKYYDVKLLSPDGKVYGPIANIYEFCRIHNISNPSHIFN